MAKVRTCAVCGVEIEHKIASAKFCGPTCRQKHRRNKSKSMKFNSRKGKIAEEYQNAVAVVNNEIEDEVREVFREEIRAAITERVRANVLGAAEALTGLLPETIAVIAADLDNKDWMKRSRAAAMVMKYSMPLINEDGNKKDLGQIIVEHRIPLPETTLGRAVEQHLIEDAEWSEVKKGGLVNPDLPYNAETNPEVFEKDYPICTGCHERKPPDMIKGRGKCSTCEWRDRVMRRMQDPAADLDRS